MACGNNTRHRAEYPGDLTNAIQVAAGYSHSIALRADGTVETWGTGYAPLVLFASPVFLESPRIPFRIPSLFR